MINNQSDVSSVKSDPLELLFAGLSLSACDLIPRSDALGLNSIYDVSSDSSSSSLIINFFISSLF